MTIELQLVQGGNRKRADDARVEHRCEGNVVFLTHRSWYGHTVPTALEVLSRMPTWIDPDVRELAESFTPHFLTRHADLWLRSREDVGLFVSLSRSPWDPVGSRRARTRMGIPDPYWTVPVRRTEGRTWMHVHLPPVVSARPMVACASLRGDVQRCSGTRYLYTFERVDADWALVELDERGMAAEQSDYRAIDPACIDPRNLPLRPSR